MPSNIPNLHNLALLICHLFIGGNFRYGHILYDQKVFDNSLLTEINSNCPVQIPWFISDITQSIALPWKMIEKTDQILQLIYPDPKHLTERIDEFKEYFTFYRVFVFTSTTNETNAKKQISIIGQHSPIFSSNCLIVHLNPTNDFMNVQLISKSDGVIEPNGMLNFHGTFDEQVINADFENVFDHTFGEFERMQPLTITTEGIFKQIKEYKKYVPLYGELYFANFFIGSLNATFINMSCLPAEMVFVPWNPPVIPLKQQQSKYYKELYLEYEPINDQNL